MSRKYLAVLAAAAVLVLAVGLVLRGRLRRSAAPAAIAAPPSEASALQELTQAAQLGRSAAYLAERVAAVAPQVTFLPDLGGAGVRWRGDTVLATDRTAPVVVRRGPAGADAAAGPTVVPVGDSAAAPGAPRGWLLVVGRAADGRVLSATGMAGGRHAVRCGAPAGAPSDAYLLGVSLADVLAGAGVFDLDGRTLGMVVRCPGGLAALPMAAVLRLAAAGPGTTRPAVDRYGLVLDTLDARARAYTRTDSGLFVTAVRRGSPADAAGLRVGDVVLAINGRPARGDTVAALLAAPPADGHRVVRRRAGTRATLRLRGPADDSTAGGGLGLSLTTDPPSFGVPIGAVGAGSPAARAGLRAGDRLVRVGDVAATTPAAAERLLRAVGGTGAPLVVARDGVERAVWLPSGAPDTPAAAPAGSAP